MIQDFGAPFFVAVNNRLCVRVRAKTMAAFLKLDAQLLEVVNLAVKDHPHSFLRIRHRLMASDQINDGKAPEAKPYCTGNKVALVVRTTMYHRLGHSPDRFRFDRLVPD